MAQQASCTERERQAPKNGLLPPLLLCLAVIAVPEIAAADPFAAVRDKIHTALEEQGVPSVAVAVARRGKIIWEEGFGLADRENLLCAEPHIPYSLASVSKPITATGLMILVERGLVDLDRPINDYLGSAKLKGYAGDVSRATMRRVLTHTAGLPLHYHFFLHNEPYPRPPMEETIRRYGVLVSKPGERFQYSNLGYGLLDYVIKRVSGKSYPDFMREEVFLPLGMKAAFIPLDAEETGACAARYWNSDTRLPFYDFDHRGGSAVFSSAHDLVRFGMFHLKSRLSDQRAVLSSGSIERMQRPLAETGSGRHYGLGWMISRHRGLRIVEHGGSMGGVRTSLTLVPQRKIAIAVLANASLAPVMEIRDEILEALLGLPGPDRRPSPRPAHGRLLEKEANPPRRNLPRKLAGLWAGHIRTYQGEISFRLRFTAPGHVEAQIGEQPENEVKNVVFHGNRLNGVLQGDVDTEDANRRSYFLQLALQRRGDVLSGAITAVSFPGPALANALTSWVEVKKREGAKERRKE